MLKLLNLKFLELFQKCFVSEMFQKIFRQEAWKKKKTGLYGTVYDFSANYGAILVDDILRICKYLIKKTQHSIKNLNL